MGAENLTDYVDSLSSQCKQWELQLDSEWLGSGVLQVLVVQTVREILMSRGEVKKPWREAPTWFLDVNLNRLYFQVKYLNL